MILVPRLLCSCFVIGLFLRWWLTSPCHKNLEYYFFGMFRKQKDHPFQWFDFDFGEYSQNLLFVCLLQKSLQLRKSFEKCYPKHFVFTCFFSLLFVCCFDVPFSIGHRRPYIIPFMSVDEFLKDGALSWRPVRARTNITPHVSDFFNYHRIFRHFYESFMRFSEVTKESFESSFEYIPERLWGHYSDVFL